MNSLLRLNSISLIGEWLLVAPILGWFELPNNKWTSKQQRRQQHSFWTTTIKFTLQTCQPRDQSPSGRPRTNEASFWASFRREKTRTSFDYTTSWPPTNLLNSRNSQPPPNWQTHNILAPLSTTCLPTISYHSTRITATPPAATLRFLQTHLQEATLPRIWTMSRRRGS